MSLNGVYPNKYFYRVSGNRACGGILNTKYLRLFQFVPGGEVNNWRFERFYFSEK